MRSRPRKAGLRRWDRCADEHIEAVTSKDVNLDTSKVARVISVPPTNPIMAFAAQQLTPSVK